MAVEDAVHGVTDEDGEPEVEYVVAWPRDWRPRVRACDRLSGEQDDR